MHENRQRGREIWTAGNFGKGKKEGIKEENRRTMS
jgi:hypothetical protein